MNIVWLMVFYVPHSNSVTIGQEFDTQAKCEKAAIAIVSAANESRWGSTVRNPICVRVEK